MGLGDSNEVPGESCGSGWETNKNEMEFDMAQGKRHVPDQIADLMRQIEVAVTNRETMPSVCQVGGIPSFSTQQGLFVP
jgi:hypothetical protein